MDIKAIEGNLERKEKRFMLMISILYKQLCLSTWRIIGSFCHMLDLLESHWLIFVKYLEAVKLASSS